MTGRVGSVLVALALADLAWFAFATHLISVRLDLSLIVQGPCAWERRLGECPIPGFSD